MSKKNRPPKNDTQTQVDVQADRFAESTDVVTGEPSIRSIVDARSLFEGADIEHEPNEADLENTIETPVTPDAGPRLSLVHGDEEDYADDGLIALAPADPDPNAAEEVADTYPWLADDRRRRPASRQSDMDIDSILAAEADSLSAESHASDLIVSEHAAPTACGARPTSIDRPARKPMPALPKPGEIAGIADRLGPTYAAQSRPTARTPDVPALTTGPTRAVSTAALGAPILTTAAVSAPIGGSTLESRSPSISTPIDIATSKPTTAGAATPASIAPNSPVAAAISTLSPSAINIAGPSGVGIAASSGTPAVTLSRSVGIASDSASEAFDFAAESSGKSVAAKPPHKNAATPRRIGSGKLVQSRITWKPGDPLAEAAPSDAVPGRFRWELMLSTACGTAVFGIAFFWLMRMIF